MGVIVGASRANSLHRKDEGDKALLLDMLAGGGKADGYAYDGGHGDGSSGHVHGVGYSTRERVAPGGKCRGEARVSGDTFYKAGAAAWRPSTPWPHHAMPLPPVAGGRRKG